MKNLLISLAVLCCLMQAQAQEYSPVYLDQQDPDNIEADDSLEYRFSEEGRATFDGDIRSGYFNSRVDARDGSREDSDEFTLRLRYGVNLGFSDFARLKARLAATCSDSSCDPNVDVGSTPSNGANIDDGDIVIDEFYLDFFERGRFDLALGRMQTRSVTRGGVFISSLTRLTSPNVAVNWTDGAALRYTTEDGWQSHLILQYNDSDGSSTLARAPLDFDDDDSRYSLFYSLESRRPWGVLTQRAVDVTYMPSALLRDGDREGRVEDYWNLVGRFASQWPQGNTTRPSLIVSGELGYAPETPSEEALGVGSSGDSDGLAWHLEASWMNFKPGHSIGINAGYTDAGWLLSPSYRPNEEALTLRYHWRPLPRVQLEVQGRWREDREPLLGSQRKRDTFDYRVRLSWVFETRKSQVFGG